jgi:metallophosphoesterase superfamily enzyme
VVLGDFLHARESHSPGTLQALQDWRARHPALDCVVIQGNHDRHAGQVQASLGFVAQTVPFEAPGLIGVHEAHEADMLLAQGPPDAHPLVLTGHEHPVVTLRDRLDRLRLPCYRLRGSVLTLPAFGEFTGGHAAHLPTDRLFAIADKVHAL